MSYTLGFVNAVITSALVFYTFFFSCDNFDKGKTPLNDPTCMNNPKDIHFKILLNSTGYLIFDFILYYFLVGATGSLAMQTYGHHVAAATGFMTCCWIQDFAVVFSIISLIVEVSTIFLNIRWFTFELKIKSTIFPLINSILLFVSYLAVRVIFQTYISCKIIYPWLYETLRNPKPQNGQNELLYQIAACYITLVNLLSQIINFYWFGLILK